MGNYFFYLNGATNVNLVVLSSNYYSKAITQSLIYHKAPDKASFKHSSMQSTLSVQTHEKRGIAESLHT